MCVYTHMHIYCKIYICARQVPAFIQTERVDTKKVLSIGSALAMHQ
jgi:hypothetical protein